MSPSNNSSRSKPDRKERLGAALRANLQRRKEGRKKAQKQAERSSSAPPTNSIDTGKEKE